MTDHLLCNMADYLCIFTTDLEFTAELTNLLSHLICIAIS